MSRLLGNNIYGQFQITHQEILLNHLLRKVGQKLYFKRKIVFRDDLFVEIILCTWRCLGQKGGSALPVLFKIWKHKDKTKINELSLFKSPFLSLSKLDLIEYIYQAMYFLKIRFVFHCGKQHGCDITTCMCGKWRTLKLIKGP